MLANFDNFDVDFGKKGNVLRELYLLLKDYDGVVVPDTLVLSLNFFNKVIKERLLASKTLFDKQERKEIIRCIRRKFGSKKLVIRSSASCEDSILFTNSGQYDSFLNLTKDEEIINAIEKIYYSFISDNAKKYSEVNNVDISNEGMAVLIQEVAPVYKAGVMFTKNPVTGLNTPVIEYCEGLGEAVVSGQSKVNRISDNYSDIEKIFTKLISIGKVIEEDMGISQDIEWGIDRNNIIYIFQARPIVINSRNCSYFAEINSMKKYFANEVISKGFTVGRIMTDLPYKVIIQDGHLTSKDLIPIIESKGIILRVGGMLSHFANIIREFNKPCMVIPENIQLDNNKLYVLDAYNGKIILFEQLTFDEQICALWNYFCDLVFNANVNYKSKLGIVNYCFGTEKSDNLFIYPYIVNNVLTIKCRGYFLNIEFSTAKDAEALLKEFN